MVAALALVVLAALGTLAWADRSASDQVPEGVTVGGVDVGGLTRAAAIDRLEEQIGSPSQRPVQVRAGGRTVTLTAARAGVRVDLAGAVDRAVATGRQGNFIGRGWREVSGGQVHADVPATIAVDRRAVTKFVDGVEKRVARPAVNAELSMDVTSVAVTPGRTGRRLAGASALERRIVRAFGRADSKRTFSTRTATVAPAVDESQVWARNPTVVTVDHDARTVRVFKKGEVVKRYSVAVGDPEFPTPYGRFNVQTMQKNPTWNVPDSDWAGDLAGKTIPGGDPRNPLVARWIGFSGSVGFHGTKDAASLGSAASHGCVRMDPGDVTDLFERVQVGTPVLVG